MPPSALLHARFLPRPTRFRGLPPTRTVGNFKNLKKYLPVWLLVRHPPWMYHQVLADFLIFAWKFQGNAVCAASTISAGNGNSYKLPPLIAAFNRTVLSAYCVSTIGRCTATSIVNAIVHVDVDREGSHKAGWWIDSPPSHSQSTRMTDSRRICG